MLSPDFFVSGRPCPALLSGLPTALLAAGCALPPTTVAEQRETFDSASTYTRSYPNATAAATCEAARRALLSQGYLLVTAGADTVQGRKHFQPKSDVHVEIDLRIVCATEAGGRPGAIAFVNALQDRYALKKSANSASVGVGAFGSVSLPFASSDDSLVRVASETLTTATFYERFFTLVERFLPAAQDSATLPPDPSASAPPGGAASASRPG